MAQTNSWTLISVCKLTSKFRPFERVCRWRAIQMMTYLYPNILISSLQLDKCETVLLMSFVTRVQSDDEYHVPCVPGNWEASETAWSRLVCLHLARASLSVTLILFKFRRPPLNERNRAECNAILPTSRFSRVELWPTQQSISWRPPSTRSRPVTIYVIIVTSTYCVSMLQYLSFLVLHVTFKDELYRLACFMSNYTNQQSIL